MSVVHSVSPLLEHKLRESLFCSPTYLRHLNSALSGCTKSSGVSKWRKTPPTKSKLSSLFPGGWMPSRSCDWQVHMSLINENGETHSHLLNALGFVGNIVQTMESSRGGQRELRTIMIGNPGPGAGEGPAPGLRPILQLHSLTVGPPADSVPSSPPRPRCKDSRR